MDHRENLLRCVRFERPDVIPMVFLINPACWQHYPHDALQELMERHPMLFPGFRAAASYTPEFSLVQRAGAPYRDPWGCVWRTSEDGITGVVTEHPLADWAAFEGYEAPDPERTDGLAPVDWDAVRAGLARDRAAGRLPQASLRHGHTFLQLSDLRGYQALMYDMADDEPRLRGLIALLEAFNLGIVERLIAAGAEWMSYPDDLGMQVGPMIPPRYFRKYITPSYRRLMQPALDAGCVVHMHSDGDIRLLVDDMVVSGVEVVNLQDRVNGIDWIAGRLAGKVCIDLDLDRQGVTVTGAPADTDAHVRHAVEALGRKEGGLMLIYGLYPGVPLANAAALMDAMERYASFFSH